MYTTLKSMLRASSDENLFWEILCFLFADNKVYGDNDDAIDSSTDFLAYFNIHGKFPASCHTEAAHLHNSNKEVPLLGISFMGFTVKYLITRFPSIYSSLGASLKGGKKCLFEKLLPNLPETLCVDN